MYIQLRTKLFITLVGLMFFCGFFFSRMKGGLVELGPWLNNFSYNMSSRIINLDKSNFHKPKTYKTTKLQKGKANSVFNYMYVEFLCLHLQTVFMLRFRALHSASVIYDPPCCVILGVDYMRCRSTQACFKTIVGMSTLAQVCQITRYFNYSDRKLSANLRLQPSVAVSGIFGRENIPRHLCRLLSKISHYLGNSKLICARPS